MNEPRSREEELFDAARQISNVRERSDFLDSACAGNAGLRQQLEALLASQGCADNFFRPLRDTPAVVSALASCEEAGAVIGRYKLLEKIGEGGFGIVYVAEQSQPVKRRVALKIIKLGMDTKQVVARFEAERQALALMDHPNIAKVHDGGATETGRPFFVMELVRGVAITHYCEENHLSVGDRLGLFVQVCQAVQHAHQKGIIHRDLKPSNILVMVNDGVAVPKVIDFGVAKATQQELTEKTILTQFHHFIGTPAYMSPEQAEMTSADIDTRSDIYSLGVLLYELLTGGTPFDGKELMSQGIDAMRRTIREKEPPRPSTRLTQSLGAVEVTRRTFGGAEASASSRRRLQGLVHQVKGDLDWIVMKCLEKDRARRYETANGLVTDLRRHLNHEPVTARPQSAAYRLQKLIGRHKLQVAAITAIGMALIAGTLVSSWQAVRANRAGQIARDQAEVAVAVKEFLAEQVLKTGSPYVDTTGDPNQRAVVERVGRKLEGRFAEQPRIEAELRLALAEAFDGWNDYANVLVHAQRARELLLRLRGYGPTHSDTLKASVAVAAAHMRLGRDGVGDKILEETFALVRQTRQPASAGLAAILTLKAYRLGQQRKFEEAVMIGNEALVMLRQTTEPKATKVFEAMWSLAYATAELGPFEKGSRCWAKSTRAVQETWGDNHPTVAMFLRAHGLYCKANGRMDEARTLLEHAVALQKSTLPSDAIFLLQDEIWLANLYQQMGQTERALEIYRTVPSRSENDLGLIAARKWVMDAADFLRTGGLMEEAQAAARVTHGYYSNHPPTNVEDFLYAIRTAAVVEGWSAAAKFCRQRLDLFPESAQLWLNKAWVLGYAGEHDGYRETVRQVLSNRRVAADLPSQRQAVEVAALLPCSFSESEQRCLDVLVRSLEAGLADAPDKDRACGYRALAQLRLRRGQFDKALAALDLADQSRTSADQGHALLVRGIVLKKMGRATEAKPIADQAIALMQSQGLHLEQNADLNFDSPGQLYTRLLWREAIEGSNLK